MNMINKISTSLLASVCLAGLVSCSDWTRPESLDIVYTGGVDTGSEQYAQYLDNLKAYKNSEHKYTMAFISNAKGQVPGSQAMRLTAYPDSIDFICLENAEDLAEQYKSDIAEVHKKGTSVLYDISYAGIESGWNQEETGDTSDDSAFLEYCSQRTATLAGLCQAYGMDGIVITYSDPAPSSLGDAEAQRLASRLETFFSTVEAWKDANKDKFLIFKGQPANLSDMSILDKCDYVIVDASEAVSAVELTLAVRRAISAGMPSDRVIIGVSAHSPGVTSGEGWFTNGTSVTSVVGAAEWVMDGDSFSKCGIAVSDAQNDYYNSPVFLNIRKAITGMNSIR